jgi:hypothetical protein
MPVDMPNLTQHTFSVAELCFALHDTKRYVFLVAVTKPNPDFNNLS